MQKLTIIIDEVITSTLTVTAPEDWDAMDDEARTAWMTDTYLATDPEQLDNQEVTEREVSLA